MTSYQQSEPGRFPLKDDGTNGSDYSNTTTPLKEEPKVSKESPSLRYEDFTPPVVMDGNEVRLEVSYSSPPLLTLRSIVCPCLTLVLK